MALRKRVMPVETVRIFENGARDIASLSRRMSAADYVSFDTEWHSYDSSNDQTPVHNGLPFCATFAWWEQKGMVSAIVHNFGEGCWSNLDMLQDEGFFDNGKPKIAHNYPVDWHVLRNAGIMLEGPAWDTLVLSHLYDDNRGADWNRRGHGLKECVEDYSGVARLDFKRTFGERLLKKNGEPYAQDKWIVPGLELWWERIQSLSIEEKLARLEAYIAYATEDATDALWLFEFFRESDRLKMPWTGDGSKTIFDFFVTKKAEETKMICEMERAGMPIDRDFMKIMSDKAEADKAVAEQIVCEVARAPIKMTSPVQLAHLVYGTGPKHIMKGKRLLYTIHGLGYPVVPGTETDTGGPSVSFDAIKALRKKLEAEGQEVPRMLNEIQRFARAAAQHRKMNEISVKMVGDRIHGRNNQVGTTSGRWSSSNPNLQNITTGDKDIYNQRDAFAALPNTTFYRTIFSMENGIEVQQLESFVEDGVLVVADFSQLEYRLLAHFSQDPTLLAAFRNDWDMHSLTTLRVFTEVAEAHKKHFGHLDPTPEGLKWVAEHFENQRKKGKVLNFEIIYGVGAKTLAIQLGITERAAQMMIDGWFKAYPRVRMWMDAGIVEAKRNGFGRTLAGRYRWPDRGRLMGTRGRSAQGEEERTFANSRVQGSAADMTSQSMLLLRKDRTYLQTGARIIAQVHDEIIVESPWSQASIVAERMGQIMQQPFSKPLRVPMPASIGIGPTWATAKH